MKIKELFSIMDSEDYSAEELRDKDYLIDRIKTILDWEGVNVGEERVKELANLYQKNRIKN